MQSRITNAGHAGRNITNAELCAAARGKLRAVYLAQREQMHNNIKAAVHREDILVSFMRRILPERHPFLMGGKRLSCPLDRYTA